MGSAIISGILKTGYTSIIGSEMNQDIANDASKRLGINVIADSEKLVKDSDIIFISLKPQYVLETLNKVKTLFNENKFT